VWLLDLKFRYNKSLLKEVKNFSGARWHGYDDVPKKLWSISDNDRNHFQLLFLQGENPYARYDAPLVEYKSKRSLRANQLELIRHSLTRHYCIFAAEMGLGKSLAAIELMEHVIPDDVHDTENWAWYVGPKAGVKAVNRELVKWNTRIRPRMITYEGLVKVIREWDDGAKAPLVVIFDESSKIKTPTSQRSKAAMHLADAVRKDWGGSGYIIEMSGTPAPKNPVDWWNLCEVACPGFLVEGTPVKLKQKLSLMEMRESLSGGAYPHIITWLDDKNKCAECGQTIHALHHAVGMADTYHEFKCSINAVERLSRRMEGLVITQ